MQFYVVELVYNRHEATIAGGLWVNAPRYFCLECGAWRPEKGSPHEIEITLERVGRAGFVEVLRNLELPLFRQDVIDLWQSAGFTGFDARTVRILGFTKKRKGRSLPKEMPQYYQLVLMSEVTLEAPPLLYRCPICGYKKYDFDRTGLRVDISTWDGSSIFGIGYPKIVLCTRDVADATLRAGYGKSIPFVHAEEWGAWERFNVHRWDAKEWKKMLEGYLIRRVEDL